MMKTLAVLGAGNMGLAITDGIINSKVLQPEAITLVRRNTEKIEEYRKKGCIVSSDVKGSAKDADVLLLAFKPQMMKELLSDIAPLCENKLVISIAAGIKISAIEKELHGCRVVRAMPNTPLTVGEGVTEICRSSGVSDEEFAFAKSLFEGAGYTFECCEEEINALTALTSSAVAYFAAVENAMCDWAQNSCLSKYDRQQICDLVSKTAIGAATQLFNKKTDPKDLVKAVASPKGSTERALLVFEEEDLSGMFDRAMTACLERAKELSDLV